jgi:hypothetical protein
MAKIGCRHIDGRQPTLRKYVDKILIKEVGILKFKVYLRFDNKTHLLCNF